MRMKALVSTPIPYDDWRSAETMLFPAWVTDVIAQNCGWDLTAIPANDGNTPVAWCRSAGWIQPRYGWRWTQDHARSLPLEWHREGLYNAVHGRAQCVRKRKRPEAGHF